MDTRARRNRLELLVVVLLTALALFVRVYRLHQVPVGLFSDEAANGLDVLNILHGHFPVFFERNYGREPLFIYLQAISVAVLGPTPYALRLTAALAGAATVPAVYWMAREAFAQTALPARWLAGWTALLLALSYWHISLSRIGLRAIMLPLVAAMAFALFWRTWRGLAAGRALPWVPAVLCGVFVGLALYTYISARFLPVLVVLVALAGAWLQPSRSRETWKRSGWLIGVVGLAALAVFLPLGVYFLGHPAAFVGRAADVSILGSSAGVFDALATLARNAVRLAGLFAILPDPNLRHNPAQRPVYEWVMAIWLAAGVALAMVRWRRLPYFWLLAWLVLFALPALLTTEGSPHSLRAVGLLPAITLLPVLAMTAAGQALAQRWVSLARWLPLPFVLFSGLLGVRSYFASWGYNPPLENAFDSRYVQAASFLDQQPARDGVWLLPYWPITRPSESRYAISFLTQERIANSLVEATEAQAPAQLAATIAGKPSASLLQWKDQPLLPDGGYAMADWKGLLAFLLRRAGAQPADEGGDPTLDLAYTTYELPAATGAISQPVAPQVEPHDVAFGDQVRLTGLAYGRTAVGTQDDTARLQEKLVASGQPLWAVLRWQALAPIRNGALKASLYLTDAAGHLAGQIDDRLDGDTYLYEDTWQAGQPASSYHILPTLPAIPPGRYDLHLVVYDGQTMQRYPALAAGATAQAPAALLGAIEVTRALTTSVVAPQFAAPAGALPASPIALLGYDLPGAAFGPGDTLPLTLYWQAVEPPVRDLTASVQLLPAAGSPACPAPPCDPIAAEAGRTPGPAGYGASRWQPGEIVRDWHDLAIPPDAPAGAYNLAVSLGASGQPAEQAILQRIQVAGRPHGFAVPALAHPMSVQLGDAIALLGFDLGGAEVRPGSALDLTLTWQATAQPRQPYTVFVHVLDAAGQIVAQQDGQPGNGELATSTWVAGEVITETRRIELPQTLPAGDYRLGVGMYDAATGQRLPVAGFGDGRIILPQPVRVAP